MTAPTDSTHVACALCERPLTVRPDPAARAWLCADCSANPIMVLAFGEGRARLAETE
jgi:hypothetical protein